MNNYSTLSSNLKRSLLHFSERISEGLSRPDFKFVSQMIYGMLCCQSCHISEISRALEEKVLLKKTIERICRHLAQFTEGAKLFDNYVRKVKGYINRRTILVVDDSDITKPCAQKMEGLQEVMDGSTGEIGIGYWATAVTALTPEQKAPIGVYTRVYSAAEEGFVSATEETLKSFRFLSKWFSRNNIRAMDRGYDANVFFEYFIDRREKFVIRAKKTRSVVHKGNTVNILELADQFKGRFSLKFVRKNGKKADCKISIVPIRLCFRPDVELNLIICRGIGQEPLLLITNMKSDDDRLALTVTKVYLLRWRIEEFYGFKKRQFGFEDFRVRSLNAIRNIDMLLTVTIGYIGMMSEKADDKRVVMEIIHISKRIYEIPKFKYYAIADGLFTIFARCGQGISQLLRKAPASQQLSMFPHSGFCCTA